MNASSPTCRDEACYPRKAVNLAYSTKLVMPHEASTPQTGNGVWQHESPHMEHGLQRCYTTPSIRAFKSIDNGMIYISATQFDELVAKGIRVQPIDCRWPYEHAAGTIRGSVNVYDVRNFDFRKLGACDALVFFCEYSERRSVVIARYVSASLSGACDIFVLDGGFSRYWRSGDYSVGSYVPEASDTCAMTHYSDGGRYSMGVQE